MRIGVLGPLEVRDAAGNLVPVGGARLRSLLIRLAIDDGRPVSVERLASDLWADGGPADAANAVQALVSRLRSAAGRDAVEYGPAGYRLTADQLGVDPSPALAAVHLAILRADPQLAGPARPELPGAAQPATAQPGAGPAAPVRARPPRLSNLPAQLTSFVDTPPSAR